MSNQYEPLIPATPAFDSNGVPLSTVYGDVYHPVWGALDQARRVFLHGNDIPERWRNRETFTVCETGFGLGHNFLALWGAWKDDTLRPARLHMVSFEAHPFSAADLAQLLLSRLEPRERALAEQLVSAWPPLLPGLHRLEFEGGALTLTLAFGRVERLARQVDAQVDAFFLDGFAPRVNPEMWSRPVFGQLARMANPDATAATWCCVGEMRRALSAAGFIVSKVEGYGGKRETTVARLRPGLSRRGRREVRTPPQSVIIVGGGLAGAGVAHALALRGVPSTVLDPVFEFGRGGSHAGHIAAALTPAMSRDDDVRSRLTRAGALRARARWLEFAGSARPERCGTLEIVRDAAEAEQWQTALASLQLPAEWVRWLDADEAHRQTGVNTNAGGLWFPEAMLARMEPLLEAMLASEKISCLPLAAGRVARDATGAWHAYGADGGVLACGDHLVLANAGGVPALLSGLVGLPPLPKLQTLYKMGGQVTYLRGREALPNRAILAGNGYCLPAVNAVCVVGSTYVRDDGASAVTQGGHSDNLLRLSALLGCEEKLAPDLRGVDGWSGWRATVVDRLPVVGAVPAMSDLWLACAYGSRGLSWSALAGDVIAATMLNEPLPMERDLLEKIAPR